MIENPGSYNDMVEKHPDLDSGEVLKLYEAALERYRLEVKREAALRTVDL